jgi:NTP pyrophosphatase (non-canonical NTP hydrolase)
MDAHEYQARVMARVPANTHHGNTPVNRMIADLYRAANVLELLDRPKRAIFYGKKPEFSKVSDQIAYDTACEESPLPIMPSHRVHLLHSVLGLATEVGELIRAHLVEFDMNERLDEVNIKEELGDILWYLTLGAEAMGTNLHELMAINDAKLEKRYGPAFDADRAVNRDLDAERRILEGKEQNNE